MVALLALGAWLVLQPTLHREAYDFRIEVGSVELLVDSREADDGSMEYRFVAPKRLAETEWLDEADFAAIRQRELAAWEARPAFERTMLGFFNITGWGNFIWVAVGLGGQIAFFGRMMIQWVVSEKARKSQVPELFWWLSFLGGVCLFTYFVWRVDVVGVLGQSTGVVIYARNLRLIKKEKRRAARREAQGDDETPPVGGDGEPIDTAGSVSPVGATREAG